MEIIQWNVHSVHLKIYVPEIIRTVFIHVHHTQKKNKNKKEHPKKHEHQQIYHDADYSNWRTYNHHTNYAEPPIIPFYDDYRGDPGIDDDTTPDDPAATVKINNGHGINDNNYQSQYETHNDDINDIPENNIDSYEQSHEQGHRGGHEIKTGHLYTNEIKQFFDGENDESEESVMGGHNDENYRYYNNRYPRMIYM